MKTIVLIALALAVASAQFFGECRCGEGKYYDKATGDCTDVPAPTVENCQRSKYENGKYDPAKCDSCNHLYFKESDTSCKAIEDADKVENCEFQNNKGVCYNCKANYASYDFSKKCGELPANCSYLKSDKTTVECQSCKNKHKLNGTTCEEVPENDVANCAEWDEKTKCDKCAEGYFKENDTTCKEQITVDNCKLMYKQYKGCDECEWGYSKSDDDTKCEKGTIADCDVHKRSDKTKCWYCKQGYQLKEDQTACTVIDPKPDNFDANCQQFDKDKKCEDCTYTYKWEEDRYRIYPQYGYTDTAKSCSKKCPSAGSDASVLSFVLASLALLALLF